MVAVSNVVAAIADISKALWLSCLLQAVHQSLGSKLSAIRGILSMIHDLLILRNLLEGPRSLKLIPAKSTILQNR